MKKLAKPLKLFALPGLLILSLSLSSCVYFNTFYNAKRYYREGAKENENNPDPTKPKTTNYQKAIDSAARILEYYPKSKYVDDALMIMGKAYFEIRNFPKAKRKFEELLANYPTSPLCDDARLWLGKTQIAMGQTDDGIGTLNKLWSDKVSETTRLESQHSLADYYFDQKNYRQALLEYEKILERSKDSRDRADVWYQAGECHYNLGEFAEAEKAYKKVQSENATRKRRFDGEYKRAVTLRRLGDRQAALKICETLIKNRDYFAYIDQAYLTKAEILTDLGNFSDAEALFKRIIELYPRTDASAKASYRLGQIYLDKLHDFDKAEEYLGKVQMEKAGSEFSAVAQTTVQDLRFLKGLNRQIDSLNLDLDTLKYQLAWIAEHPQGSSTQPSSDSLLATLRNPDSSLVQAASLDTMHQAGTLARHTYQGHPDQIPDQYSGMGDPGRGKSGPGMEDPRMQGMPGMQGLPGQMGNVPAAPIRLTPAPQDSASVEARADKDKESLAGVRFRLAEHLWFQFSDYDSAQAILTDLSKMDQYPDVAARALLSLYDLAHQAVTDTLLPDSAKAAFDTTKADTCLRCVHERFADSKYDRWVHPKLGLDPLPEPVDSAAELFKQAENLFLVDGEHGKAVKEYLEVSEKYPDSKYAPKALFAAAWLDEFELKKTDDAKALYDTLSAKYPDSPLASAAKRKLTPLPPEKTDSTATDTTAAPPEIALTGPAPSGSGEAEIVGGQEALTDIIHKNRLYPQVASEAEIPGDVVVRFTVNAQGIPSNFNVLREEPQGFDFGSMAIQAIQNARIKPGYEDGKYKESSMTQQVRFTP